MADTISLLNMKGGVGKTTLAVEIAAHCYRHGRSSVLLIDLDPQFNASQYLMDYEVYDEHIQEGGTIADLLIDTPTLSLRRKPKKKSFDDCVYRLRTSHSHKRFDLLPSQLVLSHVVKNPAGMDFKLRRLLQPIQSRYDYIFIDCAPTDSVLTTMALAASDFLLIPVRPDRFSILGYALVGETVRQFRDNSLDSHVQELGTVFTQVSESGGVEGECMDEIRNFAEQDGSYVFQESLKFSKTFRRAVQNQTPAFETKHARQDLKGSITNIVREMKSQIVRIKKKRRAT